MKKLIRVWIVCLFCVLLLGGDAIAAPVSATEIQMHLGTADNQLTFVPDRLEFQAGSRYKLVLDNPST